MMSVLVKRKPDFTNNLEPSHVQIDQNLLARAQRFLDTASLPTTKDEAWKYTRLAKLNKIPFVQDTTVEAPVKTVKIDNQAVQIVVVNGIVITDLQNLSLPAGVKVSLISTNNAALESTKTDIETELFSAINLAYLNNGIKIEVDDKACPEQAIEIVHYLQGNERIANFKTVITAGKFSESEIILGYFSDNNCENSFINNSLEADIETNARLTINKVQYENDSCFHVSNEVIDQEKDSNFSINTITLNGQLVRNNLNIRVNGENATTNLYGAYLLKGTQHTDNHTIVDHRVANCNSNELYKGVVDGKATAVFNGKVFVRKDAQKINAFQSNGNILMTDDATINSKPELEIYADDVKCSHGSTTGQLDDEAVFYLRSRGISERAAKKLLITAFVEEALEEIENKDVYSFIENCMSDRFGF